MDAFTIKTAERGAYTLNQDRYQISRSASRLSWFLVGVVTTVGVVATLHHYTGLFG